MGENLGIEGRMSVRTPMQWKSDGNAGFSTAPPQSLCRPLVEGVFGPEMVNVADQRRDPGSLLNWMERVIRRRKETPEFGWGRSVVIDGGDPAILVHRCEWEGAVALAVHNFAAKQREVRIKRPDLRLKSGLSHHLQDLLTNRKAPSLGDEVVGFDLEGYGHRWFRIESGNRP